MSLAQRFERRLEGVVGSAFARVFKGQVEPVEIGNALQREAGDKHAVMGNGRVLAPNRYRVSLGPSDYERLAPWEVQLCNSLAELVQEYLDEHEWGTVGDIEVILHLDEALHTGVFGIASRMEPEAPPRIRPYDSLSLPVVPGLAPGQYEHPFGSAAEAGPADGLVPGFGEALPGDLYAPPVSDPYAAPPAAYGADPYAPPADPYGADPYAPPVDPYGADPYAPPADPYAQPGAAAYSPPPMSPPYGQDQYAPVGYPPGQGQQFDPAYAYAQPGQAPTYIPPGGQPPYPGGPQYPGGPPQSPVGPPPYVEPRRSPQIRAILAIDGAPTHLVLRRGSNVIGRAHDCDLQLLDQGVSRRHVDVQFDGESAVVYDLGSTNGTEVNGHQIGSHHLQHGDVVRVGHTRIVYHQENG